MELADLFPKKALRGPLQTSCVTRALVVVMNCDKTNQHGRVEYGPALRHRDPKACLVGALAFYTFLFAGS